MGQAGQKALAEVEVEENGRYVGGPTLYNFLAGYISRGPEASGKPFVLSNYKDAYDRFPKPPSGLRLGRSS